MDYVTIEAVELVKTGTWQASTGEISITEDTLLELINAWESERLPRAVIKIGHTDPRMDNPDWDGDPAYGQVDNLRLNDAGDTLLGDLVNVPADLAEKMASAYPQRSVEINWDVELLDEGGETVAEFPAVLTGLALLGRSAPAVKGLKDVHTEFSAPGTANLTVKMGERSASLTFAASSSFKQVRSQGDRPDVAASLPGGHTQGSVRDELARLLKAVHPGAAYVFVEDFDDEHVWYSVEIAPAEEEGDWDFHTYQHAFQIAEDGTVTLTGEPVRVQARRVYEPVSDELSGLPHSQSVGSHSQGTDAPKVASSPTTNGEQHMFTDEQLKVLRVQFGLSEDATEDDVLEAMDKAAADAAEDPAEEAPAEEPKEPAEDQGEGSAEQPTAASGQEPQTVVLSQASFAEMQDTIRKQGAELAEIKADRDKKRRDEAIQTALSSGRIHPRDKDQWRKQIDENEAGTLSLLSSLQPVINTREIGSQLAGNAVDADHVIDQHTAEQDDKFFGLNGGK